jgi:hypothetical protein
MLRLALLTATMWLLVGCTSAFEKAVEHLADSERSWCVAFSGFGAIAKAGGSGVNGGTMLCGDSGLSLKSDTATVGLPLVIVPQLEIGTPTVQPPRPSPRRRNLKSPDAPLRIGRAAKLYATGASRRAGSRAGRKRGRDRR